MQKEFFDPVINRLFVEDYVEAFEASPFEYWNLDPWGLQRDPAMLHELKNSIGNRTFADGLSLIAQRAGAASESLGR
jgi:hypothetical protein